MGNISVIGGNFNQEFIALPGRVIPVDAGISEPLFSGDSGIRRSDLLYFAVKIFFVLLPQSYYFHPRLRYCIVTFFLACSKYYVYFL